MMFTSLSNAEMLLQAQAINYELTRIETECKSVREREKEIAALVALYPRQVVSNIARIRGFKNLARLAR